MNTFYCIVFKKNKKKHSNNHHETDTQQYTLHSALDLQHIYLYSLFLLSVLLFNESMI